MQFCNQNSRLHDGVLQSIEFKASKTFNTRFFSGLAWWQKTSGMAPEHSKVVYLGEQESETEHGKLVSWKNTSG